MIRNKTILILGAGQIGEACAIRIIKEHPKKIILHTLTKQEAKKAVKNVRNSATHIRSELIPSWGNALVPKELIYTPKENLMRNSLNADLLLDFYFSYLSDKLLENSSLYQIIKKWKPNIIIDAINTATVVGYQDDPYSLPRQIIRRVDYKGNNADWKNSCINLLTSSIIPCIIRFTQALQKGMVDFGIENYTKISTTGLGGMGVNIFYTHGDLNEPGMSSGILGKVAAAGIIHQLFWSLSHTPGINIKVIVPATLVGWQPVQFGKFRSHGKNLPLIDCSQKTKLINGDLFRANKCKKVKKFMEIPFVDSGENSAYSLGEMSAITALGQMGCVTREEVAQATFETINGSTKYDLLTAMDYATLGPSFLAATQRQIIFNKLKSLEKKKNVPSIATNNLGPTVSKHLFELYILLQVSNNSVEECIRTKNKDLTKKTNKFIETHKEIRSQILSLGLPIIFDNSEILIGEYYLVPNMNIKNVISRNNINKWAASGWVDLRKTQINYWQSWIKKAYADILKLQKKATPVLNRNWQNIEKGNIGEILAYVYSLQGGGRKIEF